MRLFISIVSLALAACSSVPTARHNLTVRDLNASEQRIIAAIKADRQITANAPAVTEDELVAAELRSAKLQTENDELEAALEITCVPYADSLPEPHRSWTVTVSTSLGFNDYVTDHVVARFIQSNIRYTQNAQGVNWEAREAVFSQFGGSRAYWDVRRDVLEIVRNELKDPKRLWSVYTHHKPALVEAINGAENRYEFRTSLLAAVPVFVNDPPPAVLHTQETINLEQARLERLPEAHPCGSVIVDRLNGAEKHLVDILGYDDVYVVQWRLRREDEGGKPLVAMWAKILQDLADSVDITPLSKGEASEG